MGKSNRLCINQALSQINFLRWGYSYLTKKSFHILCKYILFILKRPRLTHIHVNMMVIGMGSHYHRYVPSQYSKILER